MFPFERDGQDETVIYGYVARLPNQQRAWIKNRYAGSRRKMVKWSVYFGMDNEPLVPWPGDFSNAEEALFAIRHQF